MKHRTLRKWSLEVSSTILLLTATVGQPAELSSQPAGVNPVTTNHETAAPADTLGEPTVADTDAPAKLVSEVKPLPPHINPSSALAEVIKLANSGLDQSVMLAFVTNSMRTFNLGAEEIIYLNDIGVPGPVVTAMIQRDELLKTMLAAAAAAPPPPAMEPSTSAQAPQVGQQGSGAQMRANPPSPEQVAPQTADGGPAYAEAPMTPPGDGSDAMFYDSMAPYGNWVNVAGYGVCWQPTVVVANPGWQPYYNCGHWVYSECGWYWLSDYSWGWAPFHYGCWFRHSHLGWCWVPGQVWGPSWVSWRYNDHYCGWAPLPPGATYVAGSGLTFQGHHVGEREDMGLRPDHYHFVAWDHFNDRQLPAAGMTRTQTERVFDSSTVTTRITGDNQTVVNNGLPVSRVAAATRRPVHTVAVRESHDPDALGGRAERLEAGGRVISVYHPNPSQAGHIAQHGQQNRTSAVVSSSSQWSPSAGAWAPRSGSAGQGSAAEPAARTAPLVIRGAQSAATRESAPPNSLVVIGRGAASQPSAASAPSAHSATSAPPANNVPVGAPTQNHGYPPVATAVPQRNWMGTVSSSPAPSWFAGSDPSAQGRFNSSATVARPENYQPAPRNFSQEVPRYAPAPAYTAPQRTYSPPPLPPPQVQQAPVRAQSYESRPAPAAPQAAPAASAAASSSRGATGR